MPEVFENYTVLQSAFPESQDCFAYRHGNNICNLSPYSGSTDSQTMSGASPMSTSSSPLHRGDYVTLNDARVLGEPRIVIVEQPVEKFRFRYKSEMMGTHGSIVGASGATHRKKQAPTVRLENFLEKAIIRCTLVTCDEEQRIPHAHRLVRREGNEDRDDPHHIEVSPENGFTAAFHGMGIIHTAKKNLKDELVRKIRRETLERLRQKNINAVLSMRDEAQIKENAELYQKCMNLNSVALCFQAFIPDQHDVMRPITDPVYSHAINNLKSALTGELKICRIDKYTGSCEGGEEVFILVEKVGKKNIRIKFFEVNEEDMEIWSDYGRFSELDVHHQYAIVFRTPPYKDPDITSPKEVFIQLERPSDSDCSEPIKFTYKPCDKNIGRKRARMSYSSSNELQIGSQELNKMLADGCHSSELQACLSNIDIDEYLKVCPNMNSDHLAFDGPSAKSDDAMFAKNIVMEAIRIMKTKPANVKERLKKLLKDRTIYGDSPLHAALRYDQKDIAKYILMLMSTNSSYKSFANIQNSSGKTPLHYAVLQNQPEIVKALLMLGADPNICDDHGVSPLHAAVRIPEAGECVDVLLSEKGTNIEAHNYAGWTALQLAVEAGSFHIVRSLVQAGADVNNTDMSYGRTALHIAVEGGHKAIVEFLLKNSNIDINKRNFSGNTALHSAVVNPGVRAKELCKLLMEYGADPYIQNHDRESIAVDKKKVQNVSVKEEVDSEDESVEAFGKTSFDLASNKPEILQLLTAQKEDEREEDVHDMREPKQELVEEIGIASVLNSENKTILSEILDKTAGWVKLAEQLDYTFLLNTLTRASSSPSLLLLGYMDVQNVSFDMLQRLLYEIGEMEAVKFLSELNLHS